MNRLRASVSRTMQDLKFLLLKFNGSAATSISMDLDPDNTYQNAAQHGRGQGHSGQGCSSEKVDHKKEKQETNKKSVLKSE